MAEAEARGFDVEGTYSSDPVAGLVKLDLSDALAVRSLIASSKPDIVLLAGAMTSVDGCERSPEMARKTNSVGPKLVAESCKAVDAKLVYYSTDYVFDGSSGPSDEEGMPNPLNVYGRMKLEGERNVLAGDPEALVIRTCANFGWNRLRSKENSVTWMINKLRCNEKLHLFSDQWVSPSYTPDVAGITFDFLDRNAGGVFHVATGGCLTRLDMGREVCRVFDLPENLLEAARLADAKFLAPRPAKSCLAVGKVERFLNIRMSTFRSCLERMRGKT